MKKIISVLISAVMVLSLFAACGKNDSNRIKIGLAAPKATHGWVAGVAYYAEKYCKANGIEYMLTVSANKTEMEKSIDSLVEWGAQALVVWPQWSGMEEKIDSVIEKEIPVVAFDVDIQSNGICKVTGNNYEMGYQSAEYIVGKVGEAASIAVLDVPSVGSVSQLRKQGFYDYLNEIGYDKSNIFEFAERAFSRDCGYEDMKKLLAEHKKIDAVFSLDDETSIGVIKAIEDAGRTDIKAITGGGGMQEYFGMIADKKYSYLGLASVLYSPSMIENAIEVASEIARGNSAAKMVIIPTGIVSAENVSKYIDNGNKVY